MKYFISVVIICFVLFMGCNNKVNHEVKDSIYTVENSLKDGIYFMKSQAYMSWYSDEDIVLQLSFVLFNNSNVNTPKDINELYLISNEGKFKAYFEGYIIGEERNKYSSYTLKLSIPKLPKGNYDFTKLEIITADNEKIEYNIGSWFIEVFEPTIIKNIDIGKTTFVASALKNYTSEITNLYSEDLVIEGLYFKLNNDLDTEIQLGTDFNMQIISDSNVIKSNETKGVRFTFNSKNYFEDSFVILKPVLIYSVNGVEYRLNLNTTFYAPMISDEDVLDMLLEKSILE